MNQQEGKKVIVLDTDGVLIASQVPMTDAINNAIINYFLHRKLHAAPKWITRDDWLTFASPLDICKKYLGQTEPEIARWLFDAEIVCRGLPSLAAQLYLTVMQERGAEIHVVTSRTPDQREATIAMIQKWYPFIPISNIHLRDDQTKNGRRFKLETATIVSATDYFDDDPSVITLARELLPSHVAIHMIKQKWNENCAELQQYLTTWLQLFLTV